MAYQSNFKRYEIKYLLTREQKQRILEAMAPCMVLDQYGRTTIRNVYLDTDSFRLIRRSIEKPAYKEKLRIRSYARAASDSLVFVELKKKYQGIVYKRRLALPEQQAMAWVAGTYPGGDGSQISRELDYFIRYYGPLRPTVFLSYEREAYYCNDGSDFRVTFDDHILCRREEISLTSDTWGTPILEDGKVLMEIKTAGGIPLWMTRVLTRECLYKTSWSKYGTAYEKLIFPKLKGDQIHA